VALPQKLGRRLQLVAVLGVLLYLGIAFYANVDELRRALGELELWVVPAALGLAFANYCVRFLKWQRYLRLLAIEVETGASFLIFLAGMSMSVTPGKMGEVFKSFLLKQVTGTRVHASAPIVVAERVTDLLGYLVLVAIGGLSTYPDASWIFWSTLGVCLLGILLIGSPRFARIVQQVFLKLPYLWRLAPRIEGSFATARVLLSPKEILLPTAVSVVGWGCECVAFWLIADALIPGSIPFLFALFAWSFSAVAGAVAIVTPGGLGVTEYLLGKLLGAKYQPVLAAERGLTGDALVTAARANAASALIVARLCTLWFAVVVGLVALGLFTKRYGQPTGLENGDDDEASR